MATRQINRLDPLGAARLVKAAKPGRHADGRGLYLVIEPGGAARWCFMYRRRGGVGRREMGLGSFHDVSLKRARERCSDYREQLAEGEDPIELRKAAKAVPTFGAVADDVLSKKLSELDGTSAQNRARRVVNVLCEPIRNRRVDQITTDDVLALLKPIWLEKAETAKKARGLIEQIFNAAKARGHRSGDNPAAWKGNLEDLLPKQRRVVVNRPALPLDDLPAFVTALGGQSSVSARALEFLILTASREAMVTGAQWSEVDLEAAVWTIPASRMKGQVGKAREHRVPLSPRALAIVKEMMAVRVDDFIFPSAKKGRPMSNMTLDMLLRRMGAEGVTVHGFRAVFRTWVGDRTDFQTELAEMALAHVVGNATERAYSRGDALDRRRPLMDQWAAYCEGKQ